MVVLPKPAMRTISRLPVFCALMFSAPPACTLVSFPTPPAPSEVLDAVTAPAAPAVSAPAPSVSVAPFEIVACPVKVLLFAPRLTVPRLVVGMMMPSLPASGTLTNPVRPAFVVDIDELPHDPREDGREAAH